MLHYVIVYVIHYVICYLYIMYINLYELVRNIYNIQNLSLSGPKLRIWTV